MSSHLVSKKSARIEFVVLLVALAVIVLVRYVIDERSTSFRFQLRDVLWTGIVTTILYVPRFWFREHVSDLRERHRFLTWSALSCIVPFMLLDWSNWTLRKVYFIVWGILAMSIFVSAISAIRRPLRPPTQPLIRQDVPELPSQDEPEDKIVSGDTSTRGEVIYQEQIQSRVDPEDKGKFVVIDITTGDYEIDVRDAVATRRLLKRNPQAITYAIRVGYPTAYRIRRMSLNPSS